MAVKVFAERISRRLTQPPCREIIGSATLRSTFTRIIMRVKCGQRHGPHAGPFLFLDAFGTTVEQIRSTDRISVIRDEVSELRSAKIEPASIQRIDRPLA